MPTENLRRIADEAEGGPANPAPEVPGYQVLGRIGRGGMGEVYLARQLTLGRLVAIKFLAPEGTSDPKVDSARFRREAELMARVSHPNILSIFDFGEAGGLDYLVVEFVERGDLRRRMVPGAPMPIARVRSIVGPVAEALAHLHRQGIVHRDLKPENILLDDADRPIVSDFGLSILRAGSPMLTGAGRGPGTLGYIAPEQQYGLKVDERADQYSLASLAYELLTGQLPLGNFKAPSRLNPAVGPVVDEAILRALREDPRDRFATVDDFAARLDLGLSGPIPVAGGPLLRNLGAAGLALGLMAIAALAFLRRPGPEPGPEAAPIADAISKVGAKPAIPDDPAVHKLKEIRAHAIWQGQGRPEGAPGESVRARNWFVACQEVEQEIDRLAYQVWEERGRLTGPAGEEARPRNRAEAVRRLYRKTTGEDLPRPEVP